MGYALEIMIPQVKGNLGEQEEVMFMCGDCFVNVLMRLLARKAQPSKQNLTHGYTGLAIDGRL